MSNNPQVGQGLTVLAAPRFKNFVVVDKTWKVKSALQIEASRDGAGNMYNYTGWSPGDEASCEWYVRVGSPLAQALDVVTESFVLLFSGQPTAGQNLVIGPDTYHFVAALSVGPAVPFEVLIGANILATLANLVGAILVSATGGQAAGTTYGTGTVANTAATAFVDLSDGNGVQVDQIAPWTSATALSISGTVATATVNGIAISALAAPLIARPFVLAEAPETNSYGGQKLRQTVKLNYHADGFIPQRVAGT